MAQQMTTAARRDVTRRDDGGETAPTRPVYRPSADIHETEEHVVLVVDMPGVAAQDVDITLERRVLTIRGRIRFDRPEGYRPVYAEYGEGDFERAFAVSEEIDRDRLEASCANGVLTLKLPKAETAKPKRITVKTA